ncbi:putative LRR receptor-like serine/threonine-protein kinase At4g29180, partial [Curcuma longa]|uniref:putative LRR receptor-like serine/threonine-protein kinase At4g29180 n=1 Tax=Curcuma longa TaxID=136217 RepID=UPI003D9F9E5B
MDSRFWWPIFLTFAMASAGARSQTTDGFLSIDCGREPGSSYVDRDTNISYVSDAGFIDTGINRMTSVPYRGPQTYGIGTLRAFPNGTRNCYTIRSAVVRGSKYLLRAWFFYGNYDGLSGQTLAFDLYLGVNYWVGVNVADTNLLYWKEIITVATAGYLSVCLVKGTGTPFISAIDVRPLKHSMYPAANESRSLLVVHRWNLGVDSYT